MSEVTQLHHGPDWVAKLADNRWASSMAPNSNLGLDDILVNIKYAAMYDAEHYTFPVEAKPGIIGGHTGVGVVTALGEGVEDIEVGETIGVQLINRTCGSCLECNAFVNRVCCPNMQLSGHTVDGTLQEYCICKASEAIRIPDSIPLDAVPPILCAGGTLERALAMTSAPVGQIIGIVGAMTKVGSLACQYARSLGFQVLVVLSEGEAASPLVDSLDADYVVHGSPPDILADIQSIIPRGPPAILVCTASGSAFQLAPQYVRPHGKVVLIGVHPEDLGQMNFSSVAWRAVSIQWAWAGTRSDTEKALCHLATRRIQIPRHIKAAEQALEAGLFMKEDRSREWTVLEVPQSHACANSSNSNNLRLAPDSFNFGRYLAYRIEELGVKDIFGVPGDSNLNVLDALLETKSLNFIGCCNELNAGYAADGYARTSSSQVAVVVVPFVVGSLSVLNAICGARTDKLKVIVIAGCPDSSQLLSNKHLHHTPGAASRDVALHAFRDVTAVAVRVSSMENAVSTLDHALTECVRQSLPVYIEIANDMAYRKCSAPKPLDTEQGSTAQVSDHRGVVEYFSHAWRSAYMPVMLVGPWAYSSCSLASITLLAERLGCAVLVQPDARGFPESHPQFCGTFWSSVFNPPGFQLMMESDLWIVIGGRWSDLHTLGVFDIDEELPRILDLQPDSARLRRGCSNAIVLQDLVLDLVASEVEENRRSVLAYQEYIPEVGTSRDRDDSNINPPVTLSEIVGGLRHLIGESDTLIADTGEPWFISQQIKLPPAATCQLQMVYASLGWALPAGLGCQLARPKGRVILLIGDGAFQMTGHEISSMIRQKVNPIIFVFNNLGYRTETAIHDGPYNYIANWDYSRLATCYSRPPHTGVYPPTTETEKESGPDLPFIAMQVRTCNDLNIALDRAKVETCKLCLIECCIEPDDITDSLRELGSRLAANQSPSKGDPHPEPFNNKPAVSNRQSPPSLTASILKLTRTNQPRPLPSPKQNNGETVTDHMVLARWTANTGWAAPELVPYQSISLEPSASVLHYCTQCFEGMRVYRGYDERLRLFRPRQNCLRMQNSARRACLPEVEPEELLGLLEKLCAVDAPRWLTTPASSLYIRPTLIGTEPSLGLKAPREAILFIVLAVWPIPGPNTQLHLITNEKAEVRAWPGGTGSAKLGANYGPSIAAHSRVSQDMKADGASGQVLWLFGPENRVTEAGASNFFVIWKNPIGELQMVTPPVEEGLILPGVMRQAVLDLARERLSGNTPGVNGPGPHPNALSGSVAPLVAEEAHFTMRDIVSAADEGRLVSAFTTGTAVFIIPVVSIRFEGREIDINSTESPYISLLRTWLLNIAFGGEKSPWAHIIDHCV